MGDKYGKPKRKENPAERAVKQGGDPLSTDKLTLSWQFGRLDNQHHLWGFEKLGRDHWTEFLGTLGALERITWGELQKAAGGRNHGNNHHFVEVEDCCKDAQARLAELRLDEYDRLFSLRLENTLRLYGIRDGRVFKLLWHDPHHGSGNGVYPTKN